MSAPPILQVGAGRAQARQRAALAVLRQEGFRIAAEDAGGGAGGTPELVAVKAGSAGGRGAGAAGPAGGAGGEGAAGGGLPGKGPAGGGMAKMRGSVRARFLWLAAHLSETSAAVSIRLP